ncbi:hypothetical protein [Azospirillum largimobile]
MWSGTGEAEGRSQRPAPWRFVIDRAFRAPQAPLRDPSDIPAKGYRLQVA